MSGARRKDDFLIKWVLGIVASIAVLFVIESFNGMKAEARITEQVKINTQNIQELKDFKLKLIRIEVMTEMTINKLTDVASTIKTINTDTRNNTREIKDLKHTMANK